MPLEEITSDYDLFNEVVKELTAKAMISMKLTSSYHNTLLAVDESHWEERCKVNGWEKQRDTDSWEVTYKWHWRQDESWSYVSGSYNLSPKIATDFFREEYVHDVWHSEVETITYTPNGKHLAITYKGGGGNICIFECNKKVMTFARQLRWNSRLSLVSTIFTVAASFDSKYIAAACNNEIHSKLVVWDIYTRHHLLEFSHDYEKGGNRPMTALSFHNDSRIFISGDSSGLISVWKRATPFGCYTYYELDREYRTDLRYQNDFPISIMTNKQNDIIISTLLGQFQRHLDCPIATDSDPTHDFGGAMTETLIDRKHGFFPYLQNRKTLGKRLPSNNLMYAADGSLLMGCTTFDAQYKPVIPVAKIIMLHTNGDERLICSFEKRILWKCSMSPDGMRFFILLYAYSFALDTDSMPSRCDVWDIKDKVCIFSYSFGNRSPQDICWSPNGLSITVFIDNKLKRLVPETRLKRTI